MSASGLTEFVEEITRLRDTAFAETVAFHKVSDWRARGVSGTQWFDYARTLSVLHRTTSGEYGTPIDEQPSPYEAINSAAGDQKAVTR